MRSWLSLLLPPIMKNVISILAVILIAFSIASAQKTNDAISQQIKSLKADKTITLDYDSASNTTKIFVRADNFSDAEAKRAGIQAMNFGMAHIYVGKSLETTVDTFDLAFWVLTKKPRFAEANSWVMLGGETLDLGSARYGAKPREDMEYLNFLIDRDALTRIASNSNVQFKLGDANFTFTRDQMRMFADLLVAADLKGN